MPIVPEVDVQSDVLSALVAAFDEVLNISLPELARELLLDVVRQFEVLRRRMSAFDARLIAELNCRGVAKNLCSASTAKLLSQMLRLASGEAAARVRAAELLGPRVGLTGTPMPPVYPVLAAAQADGIVSAAQAAVITHIVGDLPEALRVEWGEHVEADLVEHATRLHPDLLRKAAHRIVEHLDPDGTLSDEHDNQRRRGVTISRNRDGSGTINGRLAPDCLETLLAVTDSLAAPRPVDAFGRKDPRTPDQRMHDAIHDAARRLLRGPELPDCGGIPATVLITVTADQLAIRAQRTAGVSGSGRKTALDWLGFSVGPGGLATTGHGRLIGLDTAMRIADQATIVTVISDGTGRVVGATSQSRIVTKRQRLALAARDGGCSFSDCDVPPAWTETHHVQEWSKGGKTTLDNLTLLCGYHHREHQRAGWQCDMRDGLPY